MSARGVADPPQNLRDDGCAAAGRPRRAQEEGVGRREGGRGLRQSARAAAAAGAGEGVEFPDPADTDYDTREVASDSAAITPATVSTPPNSRSARSASPCSSSRRRTLV